MMWGWYGFNTGSTLGIQGGNRMLTTRIAINTTLAAAASGTTSYIWGILITGAA
jgi:ammonia channel protein AmtB